MKSIKLDNNNNTIQAFWIGLGSLCAFGFALVSSAIMSRYLTKEYYGTYKQVMYVYNTLLAVFTLGLPRAYSYFLPRTDISEGASLIKKINLCFFALGIIFSAILFFGAPIIADFLNNPALKPAIRVFSPTPIFLLPTMGLDGILATYRKTQLNALYSVLTRAVSIVFIIVPVIYYQANAVVALAGFTASAVFTCLVGLIFMYTPFRKVESIHTSISLKQILGFSVPLMFAGIWGIVERAADQFFISRWFGEIVFADFANGSMELPFVGMVLTAAGVVLLPLFSRLSTNEKNKEEIISLWQRSATKAAYILYPMVVFAWFFATPIMVFLYGEQYAISGTYFKIMLIINVFTIAQYYPILLALGKTKLYSLVLLFSAIAVWVGEYISVTIFANPFLISIVGIIIRIVKIFIFINVIAKVLDSRVGELLPLKDLARILISSIIAGMAAYAISYFSSINSAVITICFGFILFVIFEIILGKLFHIDYLNTLAPFLKLQKKK